MKKHLSIKFFIAVIALSVYSFLVIKNGKSLTNESQTTLSSQTPHSAPQAPAEATATN